MDFDIEKFKEFLKLKNNNPIKFYEKLYGKLTIRMKLMILSMWVEDMIFDKFFNLYHWLILKILRM